MAKQVRVWTGTQWEELAVQLPSADNPVFTGTTSSPMFSATQSVGDEGGEVKFAKAATNTTLNTGVTLDVYQDRVRLFETGGTNRGGYIDMSTLDAGVGTNLVPGLTLINSTTLNASSGCIITNLTAGSRYRIVVNVYGSINGEILTARFREGSTDKATAYYGGSFKSQYDGVTGSYLPSNNSAQMFIGYFGDLTNRDTFVGMDFTINASGDVAGLNGTLYSNVAGTAAFFAFTNTSMSACDGINIYPAAGTFTGKLSIYKYRD